MAALTERGWASDGLLTEEGGAVRRAVEDATDVSQGALIARLGECLDGLTEAAEALSDQRCRTSSVGPARPDRPAETGGGLAAAQRVRDVVRRQWPGT